MKKLTEKGLRRLYEQIRSPGDVARDWHKNEVIYHEKIRTVARNVAINGPISANQLIGEMILGKGNVPGDVGQTWNAFPMTRRAAATTYGSCVVPLLNKVDKAEPLSCDEFIGFRTSLAILSVPPALANRIASLFFPGQFVNTVVDESLQGVYKTLLQSHQLVTISASTPAEKWFRRNTAIAARFRELFPNTDDAWRSCLSWRIYETFCR